MTWTEIETEFTAIQIKINNHLLAIELSSRQQWNQDEFYRIYKLTGIMPFRSKPNFKMSGPLRKFVIIKDDKQQFNNQL